jgi:hypothetical protein
VLAGLISAWLMPLPSRGTDADAASLGFSMIFLDVSAREILGEQGEDVNRQRAGIIT